MELVVQLQLSWRKQGAKVVVNYAGSEAKANEVVDEIKGLGTRCNCCPSRCGRIVIKLQAMIKETIIHLVQLIF